MATVLIADDEKDICSLISDILKDENYSVIEAVNSTKVIDSLSKYRIDLVILDIWMSDDKADGMKILEHIQKFYKDIPVIMISGHANPEISAHAIKLGAYDFIEKPFNSAKLIVTVKNGIEKMLSNKNHIEFYKKSIDNKFIGHSSAISNIKKISTSFEGDCIAIIGEIGTGKSLLSKFIHLFSKFSYLYSVFYEMSLNQNFNLEELINKVKSNILNVGVVIIEIKDMQKYQKSDIKSILDVIQKNILPLFQERGVKVIINITVSQNISVLEEEVFVDYYNNSLIIEMPPLRKRKNDMNDIIEYFVNLYKVRYLNDLKNIDYAELQHIVTNYSWPINFYQFITFIDTYILKHIDKRLIEVFNLNSFKKKQNHITIKADNNYDEAKKLFEREYFLHHLEKSNYSVDAMLEITKLNRSTIYKKLTQLNINHKKIKKDPFI